MNRVRTTLVVSMVFVVLAAMAAWVAIGRLTEQTERALARVEESLVSAQELSAEIAASAAEAEALVGVAGDALGSTADALAATQDVSEGVRRVLRIVDFIGRVDDLEASLEAAEASLAGVQADLEAGQASIADVVPQVSSTIDALQQIPVELEASIEEARIARERISEQTTLWRLAVVAGALASLGALWAIAQIDRRVGIAG